MSNETTEITTNQAGDLLHVSRPTLVGKIERGELLARLVASSTAFCLRACGPKRNRSRPILIGCQRSAVRRRGSTSFTSSQRNRLETNGFL